MAKIFINYRRADSITAAYIIYNKLIEKKHHVFIDKEAIPIGFDFAGFIRKKIKEYDIMLTLIGNQWLSIKDDKKRVRIKNAGDHVRLELAEALNCPTIKVIPVLIDKIPFPDEGGLSDDLKGLAKLNSVDFFSHEYDKSADRIAAEIDRTLNLLTSKDLSPFIRLVSIEDSRGVTRTLKIAMEANLLADKGIKAAINFAKLDENVLHVSKLKKEDGAYILSALYAAEQFGVQFTSWKNSGIINAKSGSKSAGKNGVLKRFTVGSIDEMITHLNSNRVIIASASIYEDTWFAKKTMASGQILTLPKDKSSGSQAIIITKVDLIKDRIKFVILWGRSWGDKGFSYFSEQSFYTYVDQNSLYAIETVIS